MKEKNIKIKLLIILYGVVVIFALVAIVLSIISRQNIKDIVINITFLIFLISFFLYWNDKYLTAFLFMILSGGYFLYPIIFLNDINGNIGRLVLRCSLAIILYFFHYRRFR
jgi:hypothetical protein